MQHPGLNTAKGGCDALRLKLHCSYTWASWNIVCPEPSSHQRGQCGLWAPYWHGTLLVLPEQVMFTPGKQPANQQNISLCLLSWPAKTHPWPETAETRMQDANNERQAEQQIQSFKIEKLRAELRVIRSSQWWPWHTRHLHESVQAMTPGTAPAAPLERTHVEMGMVLLECLPGRSLMQVDQVVTVGEENGMCW